MASSEKIGATDEEKIVDAYAQAEVFLHEGDYVKVLEITEATISVHGANPSCYRHHLLQGDVFFELASVADGNELKTVYLFACVDAYSVSSRLCPESVRSFHGCSLSLIELGDRLGLSKFYEKAHSKAKLGLGLCMKILEPQGIEDDLQSKIEAANNAMVVHDTTSVDDQTQEQGKGEADVDLLKKLWSKLDEKSKRDLLVVDSRGFVDYIQSVHAKTKAERRHFSECLCIDDTLRWRKWKCRICPQVNYCLVDCTWHILETHVQKFQPRSSSRPRRLDECFASMIRCGNWEPVDTAEAINVIKDKIERKEELTRKDMLRQLGHVLKDYSENDIMPHSVWDWLMVYTEENVKLPQVPGDYLEKCKFFKSPQCLCFLEEKNIEYLLEYVRELSTDLRAGLVSKVVDGLWVKSLVKERIDIQRVSFNLLLDERLLFEGEHRDYDDVGTVKTFKSSGIYNHVIPKGDEIVSWLLDCPPIDAEFVSQVAEESYYTKRDKLLTVVKDILEGAATPRFGELDDKEFTDGTSELFTTVQNDAVRRNLWKLRNSLNKKVISIDAKILLNEWTYKKLHEFARLSVIENRLVVIPFVKLYLQDKLKRLLKTHKRKRIRENA
ncbi:hypothetical protein HID58_017694 [Brassica napus]|uniref:Uncharacterized protein n=1 Tax=Brassica napus TaxID=3708 RepID=A0ABQ8D7U2_BRANA|nr:hypothetical protein HID58_017694 [Brassica napus]